MRLVAIALFFVAQLFPGNSPAALPTGSDLEWVEQHLARARDRVLPIAFDSEFVAYRSTTDKFTDMAEAHFAITFNSGAQGTFENAEGSFSTLAGGSVRRQLLRLRVGDRDAPLDTLLLKVGVRRTRLTSASCPAMLARLDELPNIPVIAKRSVTVPANHPANHEIVIRLGGTHIRSSSTDSTTSLVRWALATADSLAACTR